MFHPEIMDIKEKSIQNQIIEFIKDDGNLCIAGGSSTIFGFQDRIHSELKRSEIQKLKIDISEDRDISSFRGAQIYSYLDLSNELLLKVDYDEKGYR